MSHPLDSISAEQFEALRDIRPGRTNPERIENPFWEAMVRSRMGGFEASEHFGVEPSFRKPRPIWNFFRMGMTRTLLPDGSVVFIAGEHDDFYDPDFAIYNDVIIRRWDGSVEIYGYPFADFPPTDFHSATLVGDSIFVIGSIGYPKDRILGLAPLYRLDLTSMMMYRLEAPGAEPGLISGHEALYWVDDDSILVWGGEALGPDGQFFPNEEMWALSLAEFRWRRVESAAFKRTIEPWWSF